TRSSCRQDDARAMTQSSRMQVSYNGFHRVTFEKNAAAFELLRLKFIRHRNWHRCDVTSRTLSTT
ncbi:MAG: hypothetical protein ACYDEH_12920, partial [Acidimicrobiales bacterium]